MSEFMGWDLSRMGTMTTRRFLNADGSPIKPLEEVIAEETGISLADVRRVLEYVRDE